MLCRRGLVTLLASRAGVRLARCVRDRRAAQVVDMLDQGTASGVRMNLGEGGGGGGA